MSIAARRIKTVAPVFELSIIHLPHFLFSPERGCK